MVNDPIYLAYQAENFEERYKILGATKAGRVLIGVWTRRDGEVRAVTAYAASRTHQQLYWESRR